MFIDDNYIICILIVGLVLFIMNIETNDLDMICPVTGTEPKIISCIHYPPLNMGFIVATHDRDCLKTIQTSFKENDSDYNINTKMNGNYVLLKNGEEKQIIKPCSLSNMKEYVEKYSLGVMN